MLFYYLFLNRFFFVTPAFAKCIMGFKVSIHLSINVQPKINRNGKGFLCPYFEKSGNDVVRKFHRFLYCKFGNFFARV